MHAKKHKREGIVRSCNKLLLYLLKELMCIVHRKILAFYALWRLTFWKLKCLDVTHSVNFGTYSSCQRVNNGVRSPKFVWTPCAQLYSLAETPHPPPAFGLIYEGAIGQPRQTTFLCDLVLTRQLFSRTIVTNLQKPMLN